MKSYIYASRNGSGHQKTAIEPEWRLSDVAAKIAPYAICAKVNGRIISLADKPEPGTHVHFLSPHTDELASRVYLRGAVLLLHSAAKALFPKRALIVEHLLCGGAYCTLGAAQDGDIPALGQKIQDYIADDAEFASSVVTMEQAKEVFANQGRMQKAQMMMYRPRSSYKLYTFDGQSDYLFGIMPKSAGYLKDMRLNAYADGFILQYPAPYMQSKTPISRQQKYAAVFRQAEQWADVLGVSYVSDLNRMMHGGEIADFIRVNEALHEKTIADIASDIESRTDVKVVLIAGPSSSGKTTFAGRLSVHLRVLGQKCRSVSLDNYYKDRGDIPLDADGKPDFECLEALDTDKLGSDLIKLIAGETAQLPSFDFLTGTRQEQSESVRLNGDILILEGIHGLNDALTAGVAAANKYKIFISPLTTLNLDRHSVIVPEDLRLLRRLVRDKRTRGYSFEQTFKIWDSVRRGEFAHILPYQETADVMFNSTLLYEPLVMKKHAAAELNKITPDMPCYSRAHGLVKILNYFLSLDDERDIPVNSILREFIGTIG